VASVWRERRVRGGAAYGLQRRTGGRQRPRDRARQPRRLRLLRLRAWACTRGKGGHVGH
jgi:hypothetical protein